MERQINIEANNFNVYIIPKGEKYPQVIIFLQVLENF